MSVHVLRNSHDGQEPPPAPTKDDGALYDMCMLFDGNKYVAYADNPDDMLAVLIGPQYLDPSRSDTDRLADRIRYAIGTQVATQAMIAAEHDLTVLTDEQRDVLLGDRTTQPRIDYWTADIPLVLVDTGYAPYAPDVPIPLTQYGDMENPPNLAWLRPSDPQTFLESLDAVGAIVLAYRDDTDPDLAPLG